MRKTKIVCTMGPAADDVEVLRGIIRAGMNIARLNFSHGNHEEHKKRIELVRKVSREENKDVAIMLDTKGPEIRIKQFECKKIALKIGDEFTLSCEDVVGNESIVSVTYDNLYNEVSVGTTILIDDGLIEIEVKQIDGKNIICEVISGGELSNNKSINIPNTKIMLPALTDKDIEDIVFGIENDIDFVAASFIRCKEDIKNIREVLKKYDGEDVHIISKIENRQGVDNIDEIIASSDGIMVARGDLGVEIMAQEVPLVQKNIIRKCNEVGKVVITATQMLDSMIRNARPTRAEVGDVANAIYDGSDAVMLSGETAAGKYPIDSVEMMCGIAKLTDESIKEIKKFSGDINITNTIGYSSVSMAETLNAKAIITPTTSGYTARTVSKFRPQCPIYAVTYEDRVVNQLSLSYGVTPIKTEKRDSLEIQLWEAVFKLKELGYIEKGDLIVITAGLPLNVAGSTNFLKVEIVG